MPLASTYALQWHGPGLGAAIDLCTPTAVATLKGNGNLRATDLATPAAYARINLGKQLRATNIATPTAAATLKGRGRIAAVGKIGVITQDDVTGAVLEAKVEGNYTLKEALRLLLAVAAGKTDITDLGGGAATVKFRDVNDTKDRVTASMTGSERTSVTKDVS
jgi:hypothetical protein